MKDKPSEVDYSYDYRDGDKAYIIHEGNYMSGNASLSYYHFGEGILNHFIYRTANHGEMLGDVFQSMLIYNEDMYLVINNSNKLVICDRKTMKKKSEVTMFSPRYIFPVNEFKFYITSLYSQDIYVFNTINRTVEKTLRIPAYSPENVLIYNDKVYATAWDTANQYIFIIDPSADVVTDSINIYAKAPNSMILDRYNRMWIWSGNEEQGIKHSLLILDLETREVLYKWSTSSDVEWIKPCINSDKSRVFWIVLDYGMGSSESGIYSMSVDDTELPSSPLIPSSRWQYYYALAWNPVHNNLWVGDPKSFSERSEIYIYTESGIVLDSFITQLGVGDFYFFKE